MIVHLCDMCGHPIDKEKFEMTIDYYDKAGFCVPTDRAQEFCVSCHQIINSFIKRQIKNNGGKNEHV